MRSRPVLLALAQVFTTAALAQNAPDSYTGSRTFPPAIVYRVVAGAPYSGEELNEQIQTLADGTHLTQSFPPVKVYRDSQGRTRKETNGRAADSPLVIEITDPVAQVKYTLDTVSKVTHRQQMKSPPSANGVTNPSPSHASPEESMDKLGNQYIEGLLTNGTRHTLTYPIGAMGGALGNDRPISEVTEQWFSPELKVSIVSKTTDPRTGEFTHKLTNISRTEPAPDLFQPPADYTVVDETGRFTIKWGSGQ